MAEELDFSGGGLPPDLAVEQMLTKRKREMLIQQLAGVFNTQPPATYKRSPWAVGLEYLSGRNAKNALDELENKDKDNVKKYRLGEQQAIQQLMSGMQPRTIQQAGPPEEGQGPLPNIQQPGDPKAAILRAMTSPYAGAQKLGGTLFKQQGDQFSKTMETVKGQVDPTSAIRAGQSGDLSSLVARPLARPEVMNLPTPDGKGMSGVQTQDANGSFNFQFPPQGTTVNVGNNASKEVFGDQTKAIGDLSQAGQVAQGTLNRAGRAFEMLSNGARVGGGENFSQSVRKAAEFFGIRNSATAPTEVLQQQLGESLLDSAKKLAPVTQTDITVLQQIIGSIGSNPQALSQAMQYLAADSVRAIEILHGRVDKAYIPEGVPKDIYAGYRVPRPNLSRFPREVQDTIRRELEMSGFDTTPYLVANPNAPRPSPNIDKIPPGVRIE